jgi:hypothetical protein
MWLMPAVPVSGEVEIRKPQFKATPRKILVRTHVNKQISFDGALLHSQLHQRDRYKY